MHTRPSLPLLLALHLLPASAPAEIIGYESFSYRGATVAGADGGVFWDYKNTTPAGHTLKASDWDNAPGFASTSAWSAGTLITADSGILRQYNGTFVGEAEGAISDTSVAKKVYYAIRMTRGTGASWCGLSSFEGPTERLFFGLFPDGTGRFSIYDQNTFARLADSTVSVATGRTYLLVAKLDYAADRVSLYVDPNLTLTEAANTPAANTPFTTTQASSAVRVASGSGGLVQWDDLTVATTWESLRTWDVTNTNDSGTGSLRVAAAAAGAVGGRVTFPTAGAVPFVIRLTSGEIAMTGVRGIIIDGPEAAPGVTVTPASGRCFRVGSSTAVALRHLTLTGSNAAANAFPDTEGGAISSSGVLCLDRCLLSHNRAANAGGILALGPLKMNRCTFFANLGQDVGGALVVSNAARADLTHCTFVSNNGRGAIWADGAAGLHLNGCVLADSRRGVLTTSEILRSGGATLAATDCVFGNLEGAASTTTDANNNLTGAAAAPVDARLAPPGDYSGPTLTMPPLPGSPALDRAHTVSAHSGDARRLGIIGNPDAGAAEYQNRADLARYWNLDWDGDGVPYGVEQGAGSDPNTPDAGVAPVITISRTAAGEPRISFKRITPGGIPIPPPALSWTRWRVKRTATPAVAASWETIYTYDGPSGTGTTASGVTASTASDVPLGTRATVHVTDLLPNPARMIYRLEVELVP